MKGGIFHLRMIKCSNCLRDYPNQGVPFRCPICGGVYDFITTFPFDPALIDRSQSGIWKYRHTFELIDQALAITLGEGDTPLIWTQIFGKEVGFKLEFLNPTGSFKDRGTAVLVSFLKSRLIEEIVEDSSGNAGSSLAAYSARAGIRAIIYIPEYTSGPKKNQIEAFGAQLVRIPGPRSNTSEAVLQAAYQGKVYASHAYLPQGLAGYATVAYELVEQIGGAPGSILIPAGQGNLMLGIGRGFNSMRLAGYITSNPALIGVQALACAPLWAVAQYGTAGLGWITEGDTLAEGVRIRNPMRGDVVIRTVQESGGYFCATEEEKIMPGRAELARLGFYVEPTSAIVWDVLEQQVHNLPEPIVVILTGSGLKYLGDN